MKMLLQFLFASVVIGYSYSENVTLQWPDDSPCIKIQSIAESTLTWNYNDTEVINKPLLFNGNKTINGTCNETVFLELQLHEDNATFKFVFIEEKNGQVTVNMFLEFKPDVIFEKTGNNDTGPVTLNTTMITGFANHSYVCDQEKVYHGENGPYGLNLTFIYLKIQGFGITNGSWSDEEACAATTTLSPRTVATTPKSVRPEEHDNLIFNTSCVYLAGEMQWTIPNNGTHKSVKIGLHSSKLIFFNASCNQSLPEDVLNIWFYNHICLMSIIFGGNSSRFWWKGLSLMCVSDETLFPGINQTENLHYESSDNHYFEVIDGNYPCKSSTKLNLTGGFSLNIWNLQYRAFQKNVNAFSSQNVPECKGDEHAENNSIIPIAFGASIAGFVVIALIAYFIGRRKTKKYYESF